MAHVRKLVRDEVRTRLGTIAGLTVPDNVARSVTDTELPAALVSTPSESRTAPAQDGAGGGGIAVSVITLVVVLVDHGEVSEDDLDALAVQVEGQLADDLTGIAKFLPPVGEMEYELERMTDDDGERWYSFVEMTFRFQAVTVLGDPETVL